MGYDPEPPTRRIPPQQPVPPPPHERVRETEYVVEDPNLRDRELHDRIKTLQTALALVGVLAAAALGVALWTLLAEDEEGDGRGASQQRVSRLDDRVERLEDRVDERATENEVSELREDVEQLQGDVEEAGSQDDATAEVDAVREDVAELEQQVDDLAAAGAQQPEGTTTTP